MAQIKGVAGLLCFVKDLDKTIAFYQTLGLTFRTRTSDYATAYVDGFWVEFVPQDKAEPTVFREAGESRAESKGAGILCHIGVDNVDNFYNELVTKGIQPVSKPKDFRWGRREFVVRDPDGYKLVFFKKI